MWRVSRWTQASCQATPLPANLLTSGRSVDRYQLAADICYWPVALAAPQWPLCGYGYEFTVQDVVDALNHTLEAARHDGTKAGISTPE